MPITLALSLTAHLISLEENGDIGETAVSWPICADLPRSGWAPRRVCSTLARAQAEFIGAR